MSNLEWKIGAVRITRIEESVTPVPVAEFFPKATPEGMARHLPWLRPHFVDAQGALLLSIHGLVVESRGRAILVDTCIGENVPPGLPMELGPSPFLENLEAAGFARDAIDVVLCTHLHFDHVGWNTLREGGRLVPTFPNARYLFARQRPGSWPFSVGAAGAVNWFTEEPAGVSRFRGEALKLSTQLVLTRAFGDRGGAALVPGLLLNPSAEEDGEPPLVTLGLGGRVRVYGNVALVAEWVPIVAGYARTRTFGNDNRFDSWSGGLEIATAGHVFQIVGSNSVGLATDQYLRGGDLDIREPAFRLGFNIFRVLEL